MMKDNKDIGSVIQRIRHRLSSCLQQAESKAGVILLIVILTDTIGLLSHIITVRPICRACLNIQCQAAVTIVTLAIQSVVSRNSFIET